MLQTNDKILWLDDLRNPSESQWKQLLPEGDREVIWVKNYDEFVNWIETNGLPYFISFDHDLAGIEIWKPIINFNNFYEISNFGRVKSLPRNTTSGGILKPIKNESGLYVTLRNCGNDKRVLIHRLVAEHFLKNDNNLPQVNHKDGNRWNNHVDNLEWVTQSQNVKHSHDELCRNYSAYGENHKNSLTVSKYDKDLNFLDTYGSVNEAARQEKINFSNIAKCARGERKSAGGFIWKYNNNNITKKSNIRPTESINYNERFFIPSYEEKTGYDCAKWLVNYALDNKLNDLPRWNTHSANPVGVVNINNLLVNYLKSVSDV